MTEANRATLPGSSGDQCDATKPDMRGVGDVGWSPLDTEFCFEAPPSTGGTTAEWRIRLDILKTNHPGQWTKWLGLASMASSAIRRRHDPSHNWEIQERFIDGIHWTYVRYVGTPEPQPSEQTPGDSPRGAMERRVSGALKDCINAHGPITRDNIPSATKRILGAIQ